MTPTMFVIFFSWNYFFVFDATGMVQKHQEEVYERNELYLKSKGFR